VVGRSRGLLVGAAPVTESENEVHEGQACPRRGNANVDTLRLDNDEADED
jgi:hypothetical protein